MMETLRTRIVTRAGAIIVFLILVTALPAATAQTVPVGCQTLAVSTISVKGDTAEIPPGGVTDLRGEYEYTAPAQAFSLEPVEIEFHESGSPAWADVVLSEQVVYVNVAPLEETQETGALTITVSLHEEAPVGEAATFEVEADAREGTCVTGSSAAVKFGIKVASDGEEAEADNNGDEMPEVNKNSIPAPGAIIGLIALFAIVTPLAKRRI